MIVTISAEKGLERYDIYNRAVKAPDFAKHLRQLRKMSGDRPLAILMDQLSVHSAKNEVIHLYSELDIKQILNIGYSPEFNCIESCFSQVKRLYNRVRLNSFANENEFEPYARDHQYPSHPPTESKGGDTYGMCSI